jgi:hypothetical protein
MPMSHIAYSFRRRKDARAFAKRIDRAMLEPGATAEVGRLGWRQWNVEIALPGETEPLASMSLSEIQDDVLTPVAAQLGGRFSGH